MTTGGPVGMTRECGARRGNDGGGYETSRSLIGLGTCRNGLPRTRACGGHAQAPNPHGHPYQARQLPRKLACNEAPGDPGRSRFGRRGVGYRCRHARAERSRRGTGRSRQPPRGDMVATVPGPSAVAAALSIAGICRQTGFSIWDSCPANGVAASRPFGMRPANPVRW